MKPACLPGEERPLVAEEVVAMYVADTLKAVTGVVKMHGSAWEEFSEKVHSGSGFPSGKGIVIRNQEPGAIDLDVHVGLAWGVDIPDVANRVEDAVRRKVGALLNVEVRTVTLIVEEIEPPAVAG